MTGIDKKMAEYRMQTMRIAEEAQTIERQMDALKRLQVCVERGYHAPHSFRTMNVEPAQVPLHGLVSVVVSCDDCGCWCELNAFEANGMVHWMMTVPATGEEVRLESFIGPDKGEEPAHTVDLTKPPEGDEDE